MKKFEESLMFFFNFVCEYLVIAVYQFLLEVLQIAAVDIFPLCMVVQQAIIKYQVHKLLFNLTCVLEAINTCGAVGAA